jgi:hypothetical protein
MKSMNKYSFETFMMKCCAAKEWELRKFLKRILKKFDFKIIEDDYKSHRGGKYNTVHNMLAIRGEPKVCLIAHSDTCKDHAGDIIPVRPKIKIENGRRIIQDEFCMVQLGADDRVGIAINVWIAIHTGHDLGLLITTDEEVGVVSAEYASFPELLDFELLLQVDRGNHKNQIASTICGVEMCCKGTEERLIDISKRIGMERYTVNGALTDVLALKINGMCGDGVNITCGYWNSYSNSENEYIDIEDAKETLIFVNEVIKDYEYGDIMHPSELELMEDLNDVD